MLSKIKATANTVITKINAFPITGYLQKVRQDWKTMIEKLAGKLNDWGISAHFITIVGFGIGLLAINFLAMEMYLTALLCILLNRAFDSLDGAVARYHGYTDFGIFLDAALDYVFYAGAIWGFALAYPSQNAIAAAFMMFGFTAAACTMLAYAVVAYKKETTKYNEEAPAPFYLGGTAQGAETFAALILLCLIPSWFLPIAVVLGCWYLVKAFVVISTAYYNFVIAAKGKK